LNYVAEEFSSALPTSEKYGGLGIKFTGAAAAQCHYGLTMSLYGMALGSMVMTYHTLDL